MKEITDLPQAGISSNCGRMTGTRYIAYCAEIPGANGQGRSAEESRKSLSEAIALILEDRRDR
jgi:predicted RNase H-like HicB family nuclease